jgi:endoglucanase
MELSSAHGVSGLDGALAVAERALAGLGLKTERDDMGGLVAVIEGGSKRVMLDAHIDEIGMIVRSLDGGFLRVASVGSPDERVLIGQEVTVHGREDIYGLFSSVPPHLKKESADAPKLADVAIDTGYGAERLAELVSPGDRVSFRVNATKLLGNRVTGKSLDNRAGCAAVIAAAAKILQSNNRPTVIISLSGQEELGLRGARTAAFAHTADEAVAVDVSFADVAGAREGDCGRLGGGPMIGISPVLSRGVTDRLIKSAESAGLAYQREVMGGSTSTNADVIGITGGGIACGLVSIPLRNMHTPVEVVDLDDVAAVAQLLAEFVISGGADRD